jgi:methionyl-tRNA formyltransferase
MGTPEFAVPCLEALVQAGYAVVMAITQPDKPVGRKRVMTAPPVKQAAIAHDIPVYQPAKLRNNAEAAETLANTQADLFVVVAYGKILPQNVLDIPVHGCINVHASLLPKYRGSAPIQWSIVKGEKLTGVTTMVLDAGMDTGDMLLKKEIAIALDDTAVSLSDKLSSAGAKLLLETLPGYLSGDIQPQAQDESQATAIPLLKKEDGEMDWSQTATELYNQVRGFHPWPGTFTYFQGKTLKILRARLGVDELPHQGNPGQIVEIGRDFIRMRCGEGVLELLEVQLAGSKAMDAGSFARGQRLESAHFLSAQPVC